jgi:hypothetical protein
VQDTSTVCAECTTGMEIILDTTNDSLHDVGQVEAHLGLFGDSVNFGAR